MSKGALFRGLPAVRRALAVMAALSVVAANLPVAAQDSRSLQDMLLVAIRLGDVAAVRSLLTAGADVVKRGNNGKTAIDVAVDLGRFEIAELLVGERRRQRDGALPILAQSSSDAERTAVPVAAPNKAPPSEVLQRSAEAAPEIVAPPSAPLARAPISPVAGNTAARPGNAGSPASPSVDQLLAVAQQLTLAAQALASAQRVTPIAVEPRPVRLPQALQAVEPEFMPKPGRKPETVEPANLAASAPRATTVARDAVPSETVVVRPRRLSAEEEADRLRRELEQDGDLPVIPSAQSAQPSSGAVQTKPVAATKAPSNTAVRAKSADPAPEESSGDLMRAVKGIGGFLGFGGEPKKAEQPATVQPSSLAPREHQKRDRSTVPHVPARRASELQSNAVETQPSQSQSSMPPVAAIPVVPVTELPPPSGPDVKAARLMPRKGGGLNPFDPDNLPQGAVLPLTDPLAGDAPEVSRAPAPMPDLVALNQSPSPVSREPVREEPKAPQRPARAAPALPEVPPLADASKSSGPTAMFERRSQVMATAKSNKAAEDGSILKNLAAAVGLNESESEAAETGFDPSDAERLAGRRMPIVSLRAPLADVGLSLGNSVTMDQRPLPRGVAEPDPCIKRSGGSIVFCVVPVDWHPKVDPAFSITTYLYQGSRAIARYDGGKATHYHTLFGSLQYDDVVKYFVSRYGPPTDEWKRTISPFDRPRQPNPTMVWRARDTKTNRVTILEVRRYDDTRNVFPDMEHGAVRLYTAGAQRVFPVITGMDLMAIDWAARSDHNNDSLDPAIANSIRVGR